MEDGQYLTLSLEKLQLHLDVKKIVLVTNSPPSPELFFGEQPENLSEYFSPMRSLINDTETKVTHWVYGSYHKNVDTVFDDITYINNSCYSQNPYWPKRIELEI
jgi:hypothetical protein